MPPSNEFQSNEFQSTNLPPERIAGRPLQFRVRHLLFFLLAVALVSGLIHNFNQTVSTVCLIMLSIGAPIFVLIVVVGIAIRPIFSFPWKLCQQPSHPVLGPDVDSNADEAVF
ncbi:MAG: hypothetical protein ACI9G1_003913 [Pirellulaceae bacterium]|jgi:hypothetical protein